MAGGALKYRHLSRSSAHRQALLRNLVTSLITHESIKTTWAKAKEAQRLAEKVITLGKKNTSASRRRAESILFQPLDHLPKLFDELRRRYAERPGGYTRVLRIEPLNKHFDQAPSAILELVDGPKDMRFAMTAKTLARERAEVEDEGEGEGLSEKLDEGIREITAVNVRKVTRYRPSGMEELDKEVKRLEVRNQDGKKVEVCGFLSLHPSHVSRFLLAAVV
ncbi:MAG: hypothetical protein L6R37_001441 [Teloschistes peruensis]|nr:MAG: hypothetical protein L6R37_001441 [Teloschistes peruensis]